MSLPAASYISVPVGTVRANLSNFAYDEGEGQLKKEVEDLKRLYLRNVSKSKQNYQKYHKVILVFAMMLLIASICSFSTGHWKWGVGLIGGASSLLIFDQCGRGCASLWE